MRSAGELVAASGLVSAGLAASADAQDMGPRQVRPNQQDMVNLPALHASGEAPEKTPGPFEDVPQRTGYAIVGLGHLSLGQILPAFGRSKYSKPVIAACKAANVKLMIAYRQQYEPMNRAIIKLVREGKLGKPLTFIASNSQKQGDPNQWRQ